MRSGARIVHGHELFLGGQRVPADHPAALLHGCKLRGDPDDPPRLET